ncbi:hypothetical protein FHG87_006948 [Trinorchestia longiramus]|nr:hypothetical protein FHG87_006948 [Trinorchestia longiramus]
MAHCGSWAPPAVAQLSELCSFAAPCTAAHFSSRISRDTCFSSVKHRGRNAAPQQVVCPTESVVGNLTRVRESSLFPRLRRNGPPVRVSRSIWPPHFQRAETKPAPDNSKCSSVLAAFLTHSPRAARADQVSSSQDPRLFQQRPPASVP